MYAELKDAKSVLAFLIVYKVSRLAQVYTLSAQRRRYQSHRPAYCDLSQTDGYLGALALPKSISLLHLLSSFEYKKSANAKSEAEGLCVLALDGKVQNWYNAWLMVYRTLLPLPECAYPE